MRRRDDERGAVALLVAVLMSLLLVVAAFAVDLGQQRVVRRDLQALADVVALDLARLMGHRTESELNALRTTGIARSVSNNDYVLGNPPVVTAEFGALDTSTGGLVPVADGVYPSAVEVTATGSVDFAFRPGKGAATRTALATADKSACVKVGSTAVAVRSGDSAVISLTNGIIKEVVGADLLAGGIGAVGYQGLANAEVDLLELVAVPGLNVGTVDELLNLQGLTVGNFNAAVLSALKAQQPRNTAAISALEMVNRNFGPIAGQPIVLGDLLGIDQGAEAALSVGLNVLDLLTTGVLVADGDNAVRVQGLGIDLGLAGVSGSLSLIESPRFTCGRIGQTTATSDQATASLTGRLAGPVALSIPLLTSVAVSVGTFDLDLTLASAQVDLNKITCRTADPVSADELVVDVTSGLLSTSLSVPITIDAEILPKGILGSLVKVQIELAARLETVESAVNKPGQTLMLPPNDVTPKKTGAGNVNLSGLAVRLTHPTNKSAPPRVTAKILNVEVGLPIDLSLLLGQVNDAVSSMLTPVTAKLDSALIGPLSDLLGLEIAGADVFGDGAVCNNSALRG